MIPALIFVLSFWTYTPNNEGAGLYRYWHPVCANVVDGVDQHSCVGISAGNASECEAKGNEIVAQHTGWYFQCAPAVPGAPRFFEPN